MRLISALGHLLPKGRTKTLAIGWEGNGSSCHDTAIATSVCLFYSEYAYKHVITFNIVLGKMTLMRQIHIISAWLAALPSVCTPAMR